MRITKALLQKHKACEDQLNLFNSLFPGGVELTESLCVEHASKFDWDWASERLLRPPQRAQYKAATAQAVAQCDAATSLALVQCSAARTTAIKKALAWEQYYAATTLAWRQYKDATSLAWAQYEVTAALAFYHATNI